MEQKKKPTSVDYEAKESGSDGFVVIMNYMIHVSLTVSALSFFTLISGL
jgi:hypothetical protein